MAFPVPPTLRILGPFAAVLGAGDTLQAKDTAGLPDGAIAQVAANKRLYVLDASSSVAASGSDIVQPTTGSGRWFMQTGGPQGSIENDLGSLGAGTHPVPWDIYGYAALTLTGDVTLTFPDDPPSPTRRVLRVTQDGAGLHGITWPANCRFPGGVAPAISTGGGTVSLVEFEFTNDLYYGRLFGAAFA